MLERVVHPRWTTPFEATKRVVGAAVLPVSVAFLVPLPLSNIAPAAVVALIAFTCLEQDGLLLLVGLLTRWLARRAQPSAPEKR
ncbi:exopolysaccharide biosynthesis protein [Roseomonas sp. GCM10028921]